MSRFTKPIGRWQKVWEGESHTPLKDCVVERYEWDVAIDVGPVTTTSVGDAIARLTEELKNRMKTTPPYPVAASTHALVNGNYVHFSTLQDKIDALEDSWLTYNASKPMTDYNHFAYDQIQAAGVFAIPILLAKVRSGSNHWFVALKAISGVEADADVRSGDAAGARQAWLEWGETYAVTGSFQYPGRTPPHLESAAPRPAQRQMGQR